MENQKLLSCALAKKIDLVEYLSKLGHHPQKIRNHDYWYLSPLREEKEPSFKVNKKMNVWYDHGLGEGGNIIDFGLLYYRCSISEFLKMLESNFSFQQPRLQIEKKKITCESKINIITVTRIQHSRLVKYLKRRGIDQQLANTYCHEISYKSYEKTYRAIGFKNRCGGYELRNAEFKGSNSPKDFTFIDNDSNSICVFEGFFDFLSFQTINIRKEGVTNFLILNSLAFFRRARPFMETHENIYLYLNRDNAGQNITKFALSIDKRYQDKSILYELHKDVNEYLVQKNKIEILH
ncbi:MAG TPA: toprim domain-containing protein [Puia sp.]|nr:toprim domain-containing protein [Puia sp.]